MNDVQVESAKLQISIDRLLGRETPDVIKRIAAAQPLALPSQAATPQGAPSPPVRKRVPVNDIQIESAKLQISIDRLLGRETPDVIKRIAAAK